MELAGQERAPRAWWRMRRAPLLWTPGEAVAAARQAIRGFPASDAAVSDDGRAALAIAPDGRVAVVVATGVRARGRVIDWSALRQTAAGIAVESGDRRFGTLLLHGVDVLAVRRLSAAAGIGVSSLR